MRREHEEPECVRSVSLNDVPDRDEVAERLAHLFLAHLQKTVVHPIARKWLRAGKSLRLRDFILMMGKDEATRRAEIEAGMAERGMGSPSDNPRLAERAALVSRAAKRDIDRDELAGVWQRQAADLGFDAPALAAEAAAKGAEREIAPDVPGGRDGSARGSREASLAAERGEDAGRAAQSPADAAVAWAVAHLSEREAVFSRTDLLAAALAWNPGEVTVGEAEAAAARLEKAGSLYAARLPGMEGLLTTDRAVGDEKETIALMEAGRERGCDADARPRRRQGAAQRASHGRPEGGGEAGPLRRGSRGRASRAMRAAARPPC